MDFKIININGAELISAIDLHKSLGMKRQFGNWIKNCIKSAYLEQNKDFLTQTLESTGGRPATEYYLNRDASLAIILMSGGPNAKEVRDYVISIFNQKENLDLVTVKQVAFALKVINCLKFIDNQKEAKQLHFASFQTDKDGVISEKWIYAEFEKYRSKIIGWTKEKIDKALDEFLLQHSGYPNKLKYANQQTKLSAMDTGEAIRVAVTDILFARHENETLSKNFANLCKNLANEIKLQASQTNEQNLFQPCETVENIKQLTIPK